MVLSSHGAVIQEQALDGTLSLARNNVSVSVRNNLPKRSIMTSQLEALFRLPEVTKEIDKIERDYDKERKAREERTKAREEKAKDWINNKKLTVQEQTEKNEYYYEKGTDEGNQAYDDLEEARKKYPLEQEQKRLNNLLTEQVKKDIESLKNIIAFVEDDKSFVFGSCHSAYSHGFLENMLKLTGFKVNLIGVVGSATIPIEVDKSKPGVGIFNAERFIGKSEINSFVKHPVSGKVKKFSTNYNIGSSSPTEYSDIKIVNGGIKLL